MSRRRKRRSAQPANAFSPASRAAGAGSPAGSAAPSSPPDVVLLRIVRTGICLVLTTPLVVSQNTVFPFVVGKAVFARSLIEITFVFWAALVLFHPRRRPAWSWVIAAFAVWLLVSSISGLFGVSPTRSMWSTYERMLGLFDLAHWFAFALMAGSVFRSAADWRLLFGVNFVVGTIVCATGLAGHYGLVGIALISDSSERIGSTLGNPMYLGAYTAVNVLTGAALLVHVPGPSAGPARRGIGSGAAASLCAPPVLLNLWTLWLSGTRSAAVGLGVAAFILGAYMAWSGARVMRILGGAVVAVLLAAVLFIGIARTTSLDPATGSNVLLRRMADVGRDPSDVERARFAAAGLRAFRDRPVLGWGPDNFLIAWGRHNVADTAYGDHAHNKLLEELTTKGVLGLLSYLAVWTAVTSAVFRAFGRRSGRDRLRLGLVGAALAAYFVQSLFQVDTQISRMHFSLLAAFAAAVEAWGRSPEPAAGAGSPPRRFGLRAALDRVAGLPAAPGRAAVPTAIAAALAIVSLAHFNVRLYSAATAAAEARTTSRPWPDRLDDFTAAIRGFPGLANYPRMYLAGDAAAHDGLSEEDFRRTAELVTREAERGSRTEPQNWLHEASMAAFYQKAVTRDVRYLDTARRHVARAVELAPGLPQVAAVADTQDQIESIIADTPELSTAFGGAQAGNIEKAMATSTAPSP